MSKLYVDEIHPKTSGGVVSLPKLPICAMYLSSNSAYTTSTWTTIPFDTAYGNGGNDDGMYNTSNNRLTPTVAGWYDVTLHGSIDGTSGSVRYTGILKNGTFISYTEIGATVPVRLNHNMMVYLNGSSDYLEFQIYSNASGGSRNIRGSSGNNETQLFVNLVKAD